MSDLTAAYVSRVLGRAHRRSTSYGTRVRGYRKHTTGFSCSQTGSAVRVEHETSSIAESADLPSRHAALERYAATLRAAGLTVEVHAPAGEAASARELRVTRQEPTVG